MSEQTQSQALYAGLKKRGKTRFPATVHNETLAFIDSYVKRHACTGRGQAIEQLLQDKVRASSEGMLTSS